MQSDSKATQSTQSLGAARLAWINATIRIAAARLKEAQVPNLTGYVADKGNTHGETRPS